MSDIEVKVPDIGDFSEIPVIEVFVKPGDTVKADDSLVTLESDKATMDVPSPSAGVVKELRVKTGDKVSEGTVIVTLAQDAAAPAQPSAASSAAEPPGTESTEAAPATPSAGKGAWAPSETKDSAPAPTGKARPETAETPATTGKGQAETPAPPQAQRGPSAEQAASASALTPPIDSAAFKQAHASPSVRKFARELGVDLAKVRGTGPSARILQQDVQQFVKGALTGGALPDAGAGVRVSGAGSLNLLAWPQVDFAKFGPVETKALSRIKKISGAYLARNWVMIPHVTQFEEADITDLEALRVTLNKENEKAGIKITLLAFLIKASVAALLKFPDFNSSLVSGPDGDALVVKRYFHIGFAADTPNGLVVPVIRNADQKGVLQIAQEMTELSGKAREGKLAPADMQGGCFSISSLGGIGGTAFTPIINAPEVAILGVSKGATKPVWNGREFAPRLILPLSLSYDHRVIDGAAAARFITYLSGLLTDMRRTML